MGVYKFSAPGTLTTGRTVFTSMLAGNPVFSSGAYDSIATVVGTGSSGTITFSSIPSTYTHLQVRGIANASSGGPSLNIRLNGDSTSIYARHRIIGDGVSATAFGQTSQPQISFLANAGLPANTDTYGVFVLDILDYKDANKYTTVKVFSGQDSNGSGGVDLTSGLWPNTAAITSITIQTSANNLTTASTFALYGIKG